jgi:Ser-tRNA(Ala) deacylase AlaX
MDKPCSAVLCLLLNIILPGFGTFLSACLTKSVDTSKPKPEVKDEAEDDDFDEEDEEEVKRREQERLAKEEAERNKKPPVIST